MEEDIKECEELIRILDKTSETGKSKHTDCIKNLIARNKELEQKCKIRKEIYNRDIKAVDDKWKSKVKEMIKELDIRIGEFCENIDKSVDEEKTYWKKEKHDAIMQRFILQEMLED